MRRGWSRGWGRGAARPRSVPEQRVSRALISLLRNPWGEAAGAAGKRTRGRVGGGLRRSLCRTAVGTKLCRDPAAVGHVPAHGAAAVGLGCPGVEPRDARCPPTAAVGFRQ